MSIIEIRRLSVSFASHSGAFNAVDSFDLTIAPNEVVAIVGESGSGKSVAMLAVMGLLPWTATVTAERMRFGEHDLMTLSAAERRRLAGRELSMIFQEPMSSLNPCFTVGFQLGESLKTHLGLDRAERRRRSIGLLEAVGITDPERRLSAFPHQLSGGMCQRVMIAIAVACRPKLLIADEPTTALDVTIQAQILDLLAREQRRRHMAMILITHDLGVVAGRTDEVAVMYAGRVVERAPTPALFKKMRMPYTEALLAALPRLDAAPHTPLPAISGRPPDPTRPLKGCSFSPRCRYAVARCHAEKPALTEAESREHQFACFHPIEIHAGAGA